MSSSIPGVGVGGSVLKSRGLRTRQRTRGQRSKVVHKKVPPGIPCDTFGGRICLTDVPSPTLVGVINPFVNMNTESIPESRGMIDFPRCGPIHRDLSDRLGV